MSERKRRRQRKKPIERATSLWGHEGAAASMQPLWSQTNPLQRSRWRHYVRAQE